MRAAARLMATGEHDADRKRGFGAATVMLGPDRGASVRRTAETIAKENLPREGVTRQIFLVVVSAGSV